MERERDRWLLPAEWLALMHGCSERGGVRGELESYDVAFRAWTAAVDAVGVEAARAQSRAARFAASRLVRAAGAAVPDEVGARIALDGWPDEAWLLVLQASALIGAERAPDALDRLQRASVLLKEAPDDDVLNVHAPTLATACAVRGDTAGAVGAMHEAAQVARRLGDRLAEGVAIGNIGFFHGEQDEPEPYAAYTLQALALFREAGAERYIAQACCNLGGALSRMGRIDEARAAYEEGLPIARRLDWPRGHALFEAGLGGLAVAEGRIEEGLAGYARSIELLEGIGDRFQVARHQVLVGRTLVEAGRHAEAVAPLQACLATSRAAGFRENVSQASEHLSRAFEAIGDPAAALTALREHVAARAVDNDARIAERVHVAELRLRTDAARREFEQERERAEQWARVNGELAAALAAQRTLEVQLQEAARTDPLTGLSNRRHQQAVLASVPIGRTVAVALIDVDHFKFVNDRHGHAVGDTVLIAVAQRLAGAVRGADSVARWGGEEFCIVMPGTSEAAALAIADRLVRSFAGAPIAVEVGAVSVTISVGVAASSDGEGAALLNHADRALYAAKRRGRSRAEAASSLPTGTTLA